MKFLFIAILSFGLAAAQECLLRDTRCYGKYVGKYKTRTFKECSEKCSETDGCEYWTHIKKSTQKLGYCYLLESCAEKKYKYAISGPVGCPPGSIGPIGPVIPDYCPPFIEYDSVNYYFYKTGYSSCSGPLKDCIYKHAWRCYCFEDGEPKPTPCWYPDSADVKSADSHGTIFNTSIGTHNDYPFDDFAEGKFEIQKIQLFPAVFGSITLVCGGVKVWYAQGGEVTHGDVSQTVPGHPPIEITASIDNFITGAAGRKGFVVDQVNLISTETGGPHVSNVCGGNFGSVVVPPPDPPVTNGFCFLFSLAGSTSTDGLLNKLTLIWNCQNLG